jgi:hypothetical protein
MLTYLCNMPLTSQEEAFMSWWEQRRERHKKLSYQLWLGLPLGFAFAIPILLNFFAGRFWYKRADAVGSSQFNPIVLFVGVMLIAAFIGFFSRQFNWEQNEQRYLEFRAKQEKEDSAMKNDLQSAENP